MIGREGLNSECEVVLSLMVEGLRENGFDVAEEEGGGGGRRRGISH